jgi:uncharacterized repeat protein (TIGR03803 family)
MNALLRGLSVLVLTIALTACGSGGGSNNGTGANAGNNGGSAGNNGGASGDNGSGGTGNNGGSPGDNGGGTGNNGGSPGDNGGGGTGNNGGSSGDNGGGGNNGDTNNPPPNFSIGGTVSGLPNGAHLSVLDNGSSARTISTNGPFTLSAAVPAGSSYNISLAPQPAGYECAVNQGSGTVAAGDITNITITCNTLVTATIGGSITGLASSGLVLANGTDALSVPANSTTFTMPTAVASGADYNVVVKSSPATVRCTVSNGSGTGSNSPVTNIGVSCGPASLSTLYSFGDAPDGQWPVAGAIQGSDGNLYGTTPNGGANGAGTVFRITPAGEETVLWSFGADSDGSTPQGGLIQGSDGNFYGTTFNGGAYENGTVFQITPAGSETVLWSFGGTDTDGQLPSGNLLQASDGNFYGMTAGGGAGHVGTLFRLTPSGTMTVLISFNADNVGPAAPYGNGLIQGRDGNLYGLTAYGGPDGLGTIFKTTLDGTLTLLWTFVGNGAGGSLPTGSLVEADDGNFYGVTQSAGRLFRLTPSGAVSILHTFGRDGDGANPSGGLIQDADGNLYGTTCDVSSGTLYRFDPLGAATVLYSFPGTDSSATCPMGSLVKGADGTLYGVTNNGGTDNSGTVFQVN